MKIDEKILRKLTDLASYSDASPQFGALIARGGEIIAVGFAKKTEKDPAVAENPLLLIHAEESALLEALKNNVDISGADIYVLGIRDGGEVRHTDHSYSCVVCSRLMLQSGAAGVVYPTIDDWKKVSVDEMFNQAVKRLVAGRG